ncbi:NEDD4-binding protein 2-like 1 [Esox lucius]|uniref:NEDD4-binding protein 2-like 1 n=1 Tax=Esox lucius TaxID=8010 RepID=A0AAY5L7E2_ESOLU|nr:NEDD4-binding protein 2-like 1 [Esox lucius]XP_034149411.1 NEDD4-binding protein 2-like 1 [Esox lucius]
MERGRRNRQTMKDLIILRGLPGVGKSHRARQLLDEYRRLGIQGKIYSTDRYHEKFDWDTRYFHRNHTWTRRDVFVAMQRGVTPIIVDNTNIYRWHMYPYVFMGKQRGDYYITIEEVPRGYPETFISLNKLYRRCKRNIPKWKFREYRDGWEEVDHYQDVLNDEFSLKRWERSREKWNFY